MKRGNALLAQGQLEKARIEYRNAARLNPTDTDVIYHLGLVDESEGDFRGAFKNFTAAEQQDAHFHPALLKLAEYYIAAGQEEQATARIGAVLADAPGDPQAHAVLAALYLRQQKLDEAEREARTALGGDAGNELAYSALAGVYSARGDNAQALATVESGIGRNPGSLPLLLSRASLFEKSGDTDKMAQAYRALFAAAPKEAKYRLKLAAAYLAAGKIDATEAALRDGVTALPEDWELRHQLVLFLSHYRSAEVAEREIRAAMAASPDRVEPQEWLVELYLAHDRPDRATAYLDQVVARSRDDKPGLDALTSLARIAYLQGDRATADKLVAEVLGKAPGNLNAQFIKAHIEVDNGAYREAVADLRNIIRDQPRAKEALALLSETLLRQGHPDLAIETLNQLIDQDPLNVAERVRLAQLTAANGDPRRAMDLLFVITDTDPAYPLGWETTARLSLQSQNWSTAAAAIDKLDKLPNQHMTALLLRGTLLAATGKLDAALADFRQVIEADPASPLAEHAAAELVEIYRSNHKLAEAASYLGGLNNPSPALIVLLGQCDSALDDLNQAAAAFDRAIAAHPSTQDAWLERAKLYLRANQSDAALGALKAGAAAIPADLRAPVAAAGLLEKLGRFTEAAAIYRQLLAKDADSDLVANNLAELIADHSYEDAGQMEEARQIAERFVASNNPLLLDTLAWVYFRQGRNADALAVMERAMTGAGAASLPPQLHYHYGAMLLAADRRDEAKGELQKATATDTHYPGLNDAGRLLTTLSAKP